MTGPDDEFDEFLARKRPVFRRPADDELEPPQDVDRLVLRQARDAIKPAQPERLYRGPGWGVPLAVAATLLVCLTMVLHVVMPKKAAPEAATRQIAHEVEAAPAAGAAPDTSADKVEGLSNNPPPPMTARHSAASTSAAESPATTAATAPSAAAAPVVPWRGDAQSWLAEIERLRADGKTAEADAEMALFKRQHRAYAGSPDR